MREYRKIFLTALLLIVVPVLEAADHASSNVKMSAVQVSEHIWYINGASGAATDSEGFTSNAGFIVGSEGVVVYDALGTPSLAVKLVAEIRK
jgi:hypothetical protein